MTSIRRLALLLALLLPTTIWAGPDFESEHGPYSDYSRLHYWTPSWYQVIYYIHPRDLDQYPPGPSPSVPPSYAFTRQRRPTTPAAPSSPYADPTAYYGRAIAPPQP